MKENGGGVFIRNYEEMLYVYKMMKVIGIVGLILFFAFAVVLFFAWKMYEDKLVKIGIRKKEICLKCSEGVESVSEFMNDTVPLFFVVKQSIVEIHTDEVI